MRTFFLLFTTFYSSVLMSQVFEYDFLLPTESDSGIVIRWIIKQGSTCDGMTVEHSTDSVNFSRIYEVFGTCGSANFDVPYRFNHENPSLNRRNYYRIRFGQQIVSEIRSIFIIDGTSVVIPNPFREVATIYFDNPFSEEVTIIIYNAQGQKIYSNATIEKQINLDLRLLQRGVFYYEILGRRNITGTILKQ